VSGDPLQKHSPRDGSLLVSFGNGSVADVDRAVVTAREAFDDGRWSGVSAQYRKEVLCRLASLLESHAEELALLECLDVGKPIRDALSFDVPMAVAFLRFNAESADKVYGKVYGTDGTSLSYDLHRPLGVAAGIVGWNFPLLLSVAKIAPVLAAGNTLVLKPSELTSLSAGRVAELAIEAGLPPGVLNVVHGGPHIGDRLARHHDIDFLTFTGSTRTGKKLMIASGESNMKRLMLECGGKAPNIVFDDSPDLEAVAQAVTARAFYNQGEVCSASSRLLIHDRIREKFLPLLMAEISALAPGDPLDPETRFGAIVSEEHRQKIMGFVDQGVGEGASVLYRSGAGAPVDGGYYAAPIVFDNVSPQHMIAREEIFGPVLSILSFRDESEAIRIANNTIYGLSAVVWTRSLDRAHRMTQAIRAGWVVVNAGSSPRGGPGMGVLSVGGHKESGLGTEGGLQGLEECMSRTAVQIFV